MQRTSLWVIAVCLLLGLGARARATPLPPVFEPTPNPHQNMFFNDPGHASTDQDNNVPSASNIVATISSTTDTLVVQGGGQGFIKADSGDINDVSLNFSQGISFLSLNPVNGNGAAIITVTTNDQTQAFNTSFANGENRLTLGTSDGETILGVRIQSTGGFAQLKQLRISEFAAVPEPGTLTLMSLSCVGLVGYWCRRRRQCVA